MDMDKIVAKLKEARELSVSERVGMPIDDAISKLTETRWVMAKNLGGVKEICDMLQIDGRTTVSNWANPMRGLGFPKQVAEVSGWPVYDLIEVLRWYIAWVPERGRKSGQVSDALRAMVAE